MVLFMCFVLLKFVTAILQSIEESGFFMETNVTKERYLYQLREPGKQTHSSFVVADDFSTALTSFFSAAVSAL